jgi:hypothetical protein
LLCDESRCLLSENFCESLVGNATLAKNLFCKHMNGK